MSPFNAARLESPFSSEDLLYALKQLQNDKTPGMDGLTKEFMIQFWDLLHTWVLEMVNHAWESQTLHLDLTRGILKLLPKQIFC